ncbi:MAG: dUTP diphosphatase [Coprobacillus sp.]|nr:dUTP diphosphatase [Coprobacillus sp.]
MEVDLSSLYALQKNLDTEICERHNVTYASTRTRRLLALLVEIGELINSTRCFKYWSNKGSESKERVLDEYSDGVHFFLSLGIDIGVKSYHIPYSKDKDDVNQHFLHLYDLVLSFLKKQNERTYMKAFSCFLSLIHPLGFEMDELIEAYLKKMQVNHQRQNSNY